MKQTLDYAAPYTTPHRPLWPALLVALVGCPVASIGAAMLAFPAALGSWPQWSGDLHEGLLRGTIIGGLGGIVVAAVSTAFRARAMQISLIGSLLVTAITGGWVYFWVEMMASC